MQSQNLGRASPVSEIPHDDHFLSRAMSVAPPVELEPDLVLQERFTIQRQLGAGVRASVYLATDSARGEEVALKVFDAGPWDPETAAAHPRCEVHTQHGIADFRHIIKIHDVHFARHGGRGLILLSMEYAEGGTLRDWLVQHREDLDIRRENGLTYFKHACHGVSVIHHHGALHLDLKPENLLFLDGVLKVSDFDAAGLTGTAQEAGDASVSSRDRELGTPAYMSPEQFAMITPEALDPTADIYSLGCILYEIYHPGCHPPFAGSNHQLRELHTTAPVPPLPAAGDAVQTVVRRCLQKDPTQRYGSIDDLLADLEVADSRGVLVVTATTSADGPADTIDHFWQRTCIAVIAGRFSEATAYGRQLLEAKPEHAHAGRVVEALQRRYQDAEEIHSAIERDMRDHSLARLARLLWEALGIYPDHPAGRRLLKIIAGKAAEHREHVERGLASLQAGHVEAALLSFQAAQPLNPGATEVERAVRFLGRFLENTNEARNRIHESIEQRDWHRTLGLARHVEQATENIRYRVGASHAAEAVWA